jgi:hypothetical protein
MILVVALFVGLERPDGYGPLLSAYTSSLICTKTHPARPSSLEEAPGGSLPASRYRL